MRSAQADSCSLAAARNVSAAASRTRWPRPCSRAASLAMVVVLPVPFTPTTSTTAGWAGSGRRGVHSPSGRGTSRAANSACTDAAGPPGSSRRRARSTTARARVAPTSPPMRVSSTDSHVASSAPPRRRPWRRATKPARLRSTPASMLGAGSSVADVSGGAGQPSMLPSSRTPGGLAGSPGPRRNQPMVSRPPRPARSPRPGAAR